MTLDTEHYDTHFDHNLYDETLCNDTEHYDTQYDDNLYNDTPCNDTQHNDSQYNDSMYDTQASDIKLIGTWFDDNQ